MRPTRAVAAAALLAGAALVIPAVTASAALPAGMTITTSATHDTSRPLREMAGLPTVIAPGHITIEPGRKHNITTPGAADPVQQKAATIPARARVIHNFAGLGLNFPHFTPDAIPPDTVGAAGLKQYMQWVNSSFVILDKRTGAVLLGPLTGNKLWVDFEGPCEKRNAGDPVVNYDRFAHRWVVQQFGGDASPYVECVAVSKTDDATGAWNRYQFTYKSFNDYPHAGVWSHSYLATYNMFGDSSESGTKACAMDRKAMLAGRAAKQVCFQLASSEPLLLPADADGTRIPGASEDAPFAGLLSIQGEGSATTGTGALAMYSMHVDWAHPTKSRLSKPAIVHGADYTIACLGYSFESRVTSACIPQPGPAAAGVGPLGLDALSDRLMFRLAWRKFADGHEALVATHTVDALPVAGAVRWYELRRVGTSPWRVQQQGSYLPDLDSRWMGSIAMDKNGGLAVGYSVSGPATFPSIRIAGRTAKDPAGQLSKETVIATGFGDQATASLIARWGDYSAMSVDPADDCTLWYTTEYMTEVGVFDWSTRIAAVRLPGC
ncbi:MAG: hypothetical protein QOJ92_2574 [Frankiales bacterium]|nr:hypothetical protein [Frankiales bacterium]